MNEEDLAALRKLWDAATSGEWETLALDETDLIAAMHNVLPELVALAKDGLKYRFLMEHDPVGVEEIQYMIQSNLERTANATPAAADVDKDDNS